MTLKRIIILIAILSLVLMSCFLLTRPDPQQPSAAPESLTDSVVANSRTSDARVDRNDEQTAAPNTTKPVSNSDSETKPARKQLEIYGRVTNQRGRPLANVLITEERYFTSTHSDQQGNYRLTLELPRHRYPLLKFLRQNYRASRQQPGASDFAGQTAYELNLELVADARSVSVEGQITNERGIGLDAARIELTSLDDRGGTEFYLTVFSDRLGSFALEGIPGNERYQIIAKAGPGYPVYRDTDYRPSLNPTPILISLDSLELIDIDGMIVNRDLTPITDFEISIHSLGSGDHSQTVVTDSSGFFSLKNYPPGPIEVSTRGADLHRVTGIKLDSSEYQNLVITLDNGDHNLIGWVGGENDRAVPDALVTLERSFQDAAIQSYHYRSRGTNELGYFEFGNLGSGSYRLTVYAAGYQKHQQQYQVPHRSGEIRVSLLPGSE